MPVNFEVRIFLGATVAEIRAEVDAEDEPFASLDDWEPDDVRQFDSAAELGAALESGTLDSPGGAFQIRAIEDGYRRSLTEAEQAVVLEHTAQTVERLPRDDA